MNEKEQDAREFGAQIQQQADFAERLMKLSATGARRETVFQRDPRIKRFNALGCGG